MTAAGILPKLLQAHLVNDGGFHTAHQLVIITMMVSDIFVGGSSASQNNFFIPTIVMAHSQITTGTL
jgi:hypothetical protein